VDSGTEQKIIMSRIADPLIPTTVFLVSYGTGLKQGGWTPPTEIPVSELTKEEAQEFAKKLYDGFMQSWESCQNQAHHGFKKPNS
jgi:hypothetical protein